MGGDPVKDYYATYGEREWSRLDRPEGAIEFHVTTTLLGRHLPTAGRVLDIGGGPGRYAAWLLSRGDRVVLADMSPELLAIASRRLTSPLLEEIVEADVRDLSRWPDGCFDAVIALGPLYHLPDREDRTRAVAEVLRVVRSGGTVAFAFMPVFSFLRRSVAIPGERPHLADEAFVRRLLDDGVFLNDVPGRFTGGWGVHPSEITPWLEGFGITTLVLAAVEGLAAGLESELAEMASSDPVAYRAAMEVVVATATDATLQGTSSHLLYIGQAA